MLAQTPCWRCALCVENDVTPSESGKFWVVGVTKTCGLFWGVIFSLCSVKIGWLFVEICARARAREEASLSALESPDSIGVKRGAPIPARRSLTIVVCDFYGGINHRSFFFLT